MNEWGNQLRKGYFTAWNNSVVIDTDPIPIVDEKLDENITEADLYILLGAQSETAQDNKTYFAAEVDLVVTVVNRRKATNTKTLVEQVVNQMLTIIFPTKNTNTLSIESPYNLTYAKAISGEYAFEKLQDGWKISKQITFKNRITQ